MRAKNVDATVAGERFRPPPPPPKLKLRTIRTTEGRDHREKLLVWPGSDLNAIKIEHSGQNEGAVVGARFCG